jgi:hypothetical protein
MDTINERPAAEMLSHPVYPVHPVHNFLLNFNRMGRMISRPAAKKFILQILSCPKLFRSSPFS